MKIFLKKIAKKTPLISSFLKKVEGLQAELKLVTQENDRLTNEVNNLNQQLNENKNQREDYVISLYRYILEREPELSEINQWLSNDCSSIDIFNSFIESQEYQDRKNQREKKQKDYVVSIYRYILEREPELSEINQWLSSNWDLIDIFNSFIQSQEYQDKINERIDLNSILGVSKHILGESQPISTGRIFNWYKNAAEQLSYQDRRKQHLSFINSSKDNYSDNSSIPTATIVTSLYRGRNFIEAFLENITNQTLFYDCELIIIDANSPDNEQEVINEYLQYYSNINYIKTKEKIGIYEAWNLAIRDSKSEFITNANVDDLHRSNGLELKIKALKENPSVDVVYSDVYYSFVANLPFEIAEKCDLKTDLPVANKFNLLNFNSPHNSPMWRRSLHDKIGYFDTSYKSAADYDFWLRAAFSGSFFMKISEPAVYYYHNPQGMSTKEKSPGEIEGQKIIQIYKNLFHSSLLKG